MKRTESRLFAATALVAAGLAIGLVQHVRIEAAHAVTMPADVHWVPMGQPIRGQQAGDVVGSAIAISADGHTMVVGAPEDDTAGANAGAVQVVDWDGTTWTQRGVTLRGAAGELAGRHVTISDDGDTIAFVVPNAGAGGGRVEVYQWTSGAWVARGVPFTGGPGDPIGGAVLDGDGDTLVLGRPNDDTSGVDSGSVQIFDWNGTTWTQRGTTLRGAPGDLLGFAVAVTPDGATIVTSSLLGDHGIANAGNALVFDWDGTTWTQRGTTLHGGAAFDSFGMAVAVSDDGDVLAIGAPSESSVAVDAGRVYAYRWNGSAWVGLGTPVSGTADDLLGLSVALDASGDTLAVSSPQFDAGSNPDAGRVQVLDWDGTAWQQRSWALEGDAAGDFASYVALSADGTTVAVGRVDDDVNGVDAGSLQVYTSAVVRQWGNTVMGPVDFARAGHATALDADGDTWAVGMPNLDHGLPIMGRVEVYRWLHGAWTPLGGAVTGDATGDLFGTSVAIDAAGDTIVVGAPGADNGADTDAGEVKVFDWDGTTWVQRGASLYGLLPDSDLGTAVDIDASGEVIVVGAPGTGLTGVDVGQTTIWVWNGNAWLPRGLPVAGDNASDYSGAAVAISADASTIAVGDPYYDDSGMIIIVPAAAVQPAFGGPDTGRVRVFRWNGAMWLQRGSALIGAMASDLLGFDVDLDATGDVLAVGIPGADISAPGSNEGRASVFTWSGAAWGLRGSDIEGALVGDAAGRSLSLSDDGTVLAMSSPLGDFGGVDAGNTRLFRYQGSAWRQLGDRIEGLTPGERAGSGLALSGDGAIVSVGSPQRLDSRPIDGAAMVYRISRRSTPGGPMAIGAQTTGSDRIEVTWTRGITEVLDPVTHSDLEVSTDGGATWTAATRAITDPSGTTITGLSAATTYVVRVRDVNGTGPGVWRRAAPVTTAFSPLPEAVRSLTTGRTISSISGEDGYALAVAVSQQTFSTNVDTVHLVTGEALPDALAGGVVAAMARGPVLLTRRDRLPDVTRSELQRLRPRRIVIVGGPDAVSEEVAAGIFGLADTVTRLGGSDRYATAASIATHLAAPSLEVVYVVNGLVHGDGMVAAPSAAADRAPLVLTTRNALPSATRDAIERLAPQRVVVVGGPDSVSAAVFETLESLVPLVERVAGPDLGATAVALAQRQRTTLNGPVVMVDRRRAEDGLALSPMAVLRGSPILPTDDGCTMPTVMGELVRRAADVVVATTDDPRRATAAVGTACA